ncbi:MAG: peptidylprolyl isomerase [Gemmataceae bacterium]
MRGNWATTAAVAILVAAGAAQAQDGKPAAIVNGEPIPTSEIEAVLAMRPRELFPIPQAQHRQVRLEILDALIAERLMRQFLAKSGAPVDSAEVEKQMAALAESQKMSGKTLADFCRETRQTETQVRAGVQNMLQFSAYAKKLASDAELKTYFAANPDYFQKVTVRVSHIVIRLPVGASGAERQEARKRLTEIRQKLLAKQIAFADAAREFSQCPSAPKGGDIGFIARKWMVDEPVAKAAFALKTGELSDIVESDFGLHLILATDRTEPKPIEFAACVEDVRDCYIEEMRQQLLTKLRDAAKIEVLIK